MTVRFRVAAAAVAAMAAVILALPVHAEGQAVRVAVPRGGVAVRPPVAVRPVVVRPAATVFVGGFYFPSLYRTSLYYGPYGWPSYQRPPYYGIGVYGPSGSVRLQVEPRETEVFVDGYYAGTVDDFDGLFQRLHVDAGEHEIELFLPGHRSHHQRIFVQPERTFRIRHTMEPLAPGEAEPARPAGAPPSPRSPRQPYPDPGAPGPPPGAAPAGARVEGFGRLSLRVQPGDAEIFIDGERWEGALDDERLVVELGAGVHRLEIRREGFRTYFTDVAIRERDTRVLNVALTRQ